MRSEKPLAKAASAHAGDPASARVGLRSRVRRRSSGRSRGFLQHALVHDKTTMIDKTISPSKWRAASTGRGRRRCVPRRPARARGCKALCIVRPPPDVTGSVHMGHALDDTLQDGLGALRTHASARTCCGSRAPITPASPRRIGRRTSVDEAATAASPRHGPRGFRRRVWEWKAESGSTIVNQLKPLRASCDWSRDASPWTRGYRALSLKFLSSFIARPYLQGQRLH